MHLYQRSMPFSLLSSSILCLMESPHTYAAEPAAGTENPSQRPTIILKSDQLQQRYQEKEATIALPIQLCIQDTPQSISGINRQHLDDQKLRLVMDMAEKTTRIVTQNNGACCNRMTNRAAESLPINH